MTAVSQSVEYLLDQAIDAYRAGDLHSAELYCRQVLATEPEQFDALHMLGVLTSESGAPGKALPLFRQALARRPLSGRAWENLASAYGRLERFPEAADAFRRSLECQPASLYCLEKLARIECHLGRFRLARDSFLRALELDPDNAGLYHGLGICLRHAGLWQDAVTALERGLALQAERADILSELLFIRRNHCDWGDIEALENRFRTAARHAKTGTSPFLCLGVSDDRQEQYRAGRAWGEQFVPDETFRHEVRKRDIINIAYLSPDFCHHPMPQHFSAIPELHDRKRFRVIAYRLLPEKNRATPARILDNCDLFRNLHPMNPAEAAQRIYDDRIDILVDFVGYTANAMPGILARRPALMQVNWMCYAGTMGVSYMDYLIADPVVLPDEHRKDYSECVIRLPGSYHPNDYRRGIPGAQLTRVECGLPDDAFVFCCFNQPWKITPAMFETWMRILNAVQGSVLWLLDKPVGTVARLKTRAMEKGIRDERLIAAPYRSQDAFLDQFRLADLFLDTLPYNAHSMATDSLWMACPVLTCQGNTFAGSVGASLLTACHLPFLITHDLATYEQRAIELARQTDVLAGYRQHLELNRMELDLFDTHSFISYLEEAYERMMAQYLSGNGPRGFDVKPRCPHKVSPDSG